MAALLDDPRVQETIKWLIAFRDPEEIWKENKSFLLCEIIFYVTGFLTFVHSMRHGGRYIYLWWTIIIHAMVVESLSYVLPDIDNFWHSQSMVMLLGKRLPLHIVCVYHTFIYTASSCVARLHLNSFARACAVGLGVVLLDIPFDIMGVKLLWWTWHDTDPNIYDRHYNVPWTSYYFHAAFASSFTFLFHFTRTPCSNSKLPFKASNPFFELLGSLFTGFCAMPLGVMQFVPVYHILHDKYGLHTEVCVLLFLSLYFLVVWASDRHPVKEARGGSGGFNELFLVVLVHYAFYVYLVFTERPQNIRSTGLHEPLGKCDAVTRMRTALGEIVEKKTYLCGSNYNEPYFDFHCTTTGHAPADASTWYTICGTKYPNHMEYMVVVTAFCALGLLVFTELFLSSGSQPSTRESAAFKKYGRKSKAE